MPHTLLLDPGGGTDAAGPRKFELDGKLVMLGIPGMLAIPDIPPVMASMADCVNLVDALRVNLLLGTFCCVKGGGGT